MLLRTLGDRHSRLQRGYAAGFGVFYARKYAANSPDKTYRGVRT